MATSLAANIGLDTTLTMAMAKSDASTRAAARKAYNKEQAQELIEWLATKGQDDMIAGNHEFPVNPTVQPDEIAQSFGTFKPMPIDAEAYGALNAEAVDLLAEAGYK